MNRDLRNMLLILAAAVALLAACILIPNLIR